MNTSVNCFALITSVMLTFLSASATTVAANETERFRKSLDRFAEGTDDARTRRAFRYGLTRAVSVKAVATKLQSTEVPALASHCFTRSNLLTGSLFVTGTLAVPPDLSGKHGSDVWTASERFQDRLSEVFSSFCQQETADDSAVDALLVLANEWESLARQTGRTDSRFFDRLRSFLRYRMLDETRRIELRESGFFCGTGHEWKGGTLLEFGLWLLRYKLVPRHEAINYCISLVKPIVKADETLNETKRVEDVAKQRRASTLAAEKRAARQRMSAINASRSAAARRTAGARSAVGVFGQPFSNGGGIGGYTRYHTYPSRVYWYTRRVPSTTLRSYRYGGSYIRTYTITVVR